MFQITKRSFKTTNISQSMMFARSDQNSAFPGYLGKAMASRILSIPHT